MDIHANKAAPSWRLLKRIDFLLNRAAATRLEYVRDSTAWKAYRTAKSRVPYPVADNQNTRHRRTRRGDVDDRDYRAG